LGKIEKLPLKKVRISLESTKDRNDIFYIEGSINCNGEGSLILTKENKFNLDLYLPPGKYDYKIFRNQYQQIGNDKLIMVSKKGYFFNKNSKYESSGYSIYFIYSNKPANIIMEMKKCSKQDELQSGKIIRKYGIVYYFIKRNDSILSLKINGREIIINAINNSNEEIQSSKIIYQIFPDRFFRYGGESISKLSPWESLPENNTFYGGNLKGIIKKMVYLKELNVEYLYLNPIFKSHSNHRYDVDDYFEIDPLLGDNEDFKNLIKEAHRNGIKIIMDMVFNHTSTNHHFFQDVLKYGRRSKYYNYYIFHRDEFKRFKGHWDFFKGDITCPSYETFMGYGMMPKLNLRNEQVIEYLKGVVQYWKSEFGIDGIRYDAANSLPQPFVREIMLDNKEILHIGEVWCASPLYAEKYYYDGITNYFLRELILSMISGKISIKKFLHSYYEFLFIYKEKADKSMNLLSSHDIERIMTVLSHDENNVLLAYTILFMMNGYSLIYYGDEIGMEGGKDPDCRRTFKWDSFNEKFFNYFRKLTKFRRDYNIMKNGIITVLNKRSLKGLSKISKDEKLNLYFGNKSGKIKIEGKILAGRNYVWVGRRTIEMRKNGFVLEYLSKI